MGIREDFDVEVAEWLRVTQDLPVYAILSYETQSLGLYQFQTRIYYCTEGSDLEPAKEFVYDGTLEELLDEL